MESRPASYRYVQTARLATIRAKLVKLTYTLSSLFQNVLLLLVSSLELEMWSYALLGACHSFLTNLPIALEAPLIKFKTSKKDACAELRSRVWLRYLQVRPVLRPKSVVANTMVLKVHLKL